MDIEKRKIQWKVSLQTVATIFVVVGIFFSVLFMVLGSQNTYSCKEWNDGWTIEVDDTTYENQSIDDFSMEEVAPGDSVVLTNTFGTNLTNKHLSLAFYTYQSTVTAYIDGIETYNYGQDYYEQGTLVPTKLNVIDLGEDTDGKEIKIEIMAASTYSYRYIERIYIGPSIEMFSYLINTKFVSIFSSFFIISVGILSIGLALTLRGKKLPSMKTITIGVFLLMLGLWISCNSRIILLVNKNEIFDTYLEYVVFYSFVIPLAFYFWNYAKRTKKDRNIWKILFVLNIIMFVVATVLNATNVFYYPEFLPYFHIFYAIYVVFMLYLIIKKIVKKEADRSDKLLSIGFAVFSLGSILGIFYSEFGGIDVINPLSSNSILPVTSVILTLFMIGSYFLSIIDYLYEKGEYDQLTKLAYVDFLTNISNRSTAVKYMEDLDEEHVMYSVISIDVNNLKVVNDTLGHSSGDKLLVDLSKLLQSRFGKYGCVARMGGDEFFVVLKKVDFKSTLVILKDFVEDLKSFNSQKGSDFAISISYGCASTDENKKFNNRDVYILSDNRMYKMKEHFHKTYGGRDVNETEKH